MEGVVIVDYLKDGSTINRKHYANKLRRLKGEMKAKTPENFEGLHASGHRAGAHLSSLLVYCKRVWFHNIAKPAIFFERGTVGLLFQK